MKRYDGGLELQVGNTKQGDQFQQTRQRATRFVALGHLPTVIEIGHPGGDKYSAVGGLEFEVKNLSRPKSPGNRQLLSIERVKRVVNGDAARIAGIVVD